MINRFIKNVIPFLVPYLFSLKIEEYQNMGDCNQAGPHEAFLGQIPPCPLYASCCRKTVLT